MFTNLKIQLQSQGHLVLTCRVAPGAHQAEIKEIMSDGSLKIRLISPPEKGKANLELLKLLASEFELPVNNVKIISGTSSRLKKVKLLK